MKGCHLVSFDVSSLFTSIPLDETIEITLDMLYKTSDQVQGLSQSNFKKLLSIVTKNGFDYWKGQNFIEKN